MLKAQFESLNHILKTYYAYFLLKPGLKFSNSGLKFLNEDLKFKPMFKEFLCTSLAILGHKHSYCSEKNDKVTKDMETNTFFYHFVSEISFCTKFNINIFAQGANHCKYNVIKPHDFFFFRKTLSTKMLIYKW